ncbi:putative mannose-1-phosphate guanylyltransferase/mannose-6-phosphate isomerase [Prevotella sp. DNF00663]|uniref:mannose-1-phosphate guanylyltransferase n=1 Tax=Prevotella sp. DNF00663 TaxID=1384078 RepID=UPI00078527BE|nr:mannose-1-phosphate guanylyltransferase [Prevotella sp. DNF00663]KXB79212.1 putative mannose-1-phosphate guanylyltransferase/mannose-6-phosphate isomerase [Prevotella sp. DNF00663]
MDNDLRNNYCVILAGGKGRRLWPCSREKLPKQFIDFFGTGQTQLQQTYERISHIFPLDHIFVNTNIEYVDFVREQLPQLPPDNLMAEPIWRNTAPSVAWAAHRIAHINPNANLLVTPSDQIVFREELYRKNILEGLDFVSKNNSLLTMGIRPTRPEPGYGYIQVGNPADMEDVYEVKTFTEKPDREFARMFMESGEWYWNTGLFLCNLQYLSVCFYKFLPAVLSTLDEAKPNFTIEEENEFINENFPSYPNISIDYGILEKSDRVCVMMCDFGWADLGTWHGIYEAMQKSQDDNVVISSDVLLDESHGNIIKLPEGKLAVINGLDGFIVAEQDNVLLICKKEDSSALIRKYVSEVQMKKGNEYV